MFAIPGVLRRSFDRLFTGYEAVAHEQLRLRVLLAVALFKLFNFFGGNWDIQWHIAIGRDSLFIPPHMMVLVAFFAGSLISVTMLAYETLLHRQGVKLQHAMRIGALVATPATFGVIAGYLGAVFSAVFDEAWHRVYGIDSTLWSPPHLSIMASTMLVDFSLLFGIAASGRRLNPALPVSSAAFWGLILTGAYAFEAVNFQVSEAFIAGYRMGGVGLWNFLFPIMAGALFPLSLLLIIRLTGRFWVAALVFGVAILLQYMGTAISFIGLEIIKPVSEIELFVYLNPDSTIAKAREYALLTGFTGLIGFQQAWVMWLSSVPMLLVALLEWLPAAHKRPLLAAPLFGVSLVLFSFLMYQFRPYLDSLPITLADVLLSAALAGGLGWLAGYLGLRLAERGAGKAPLSQ